MFFKAILHCTLLLLTEEQKENMLVLYRKGLQNRCFPLYKVANSSKEYNSVFNQWSSFARNAKQSTDDNPGYES